MKHVLTILLTILMLVSCNDRQETAPNINFLPVDMGKEVNVSCFLMEPNGSAWIGLDGQGLAYRESEGTPYRFYDKLAGTLPSDVVINCYKDSHGRLWFGTFGNGLFYRQGGAFLLPDNEQLRDPRLEYVSGFMEDSQGSLWIGTQKSGLACCDSTGQVTLYDENNSGLQTNWIADMATFDRQTIYVASGWGLFQLDTRHRHISVVTDHQGHAFLEKQLVRSICAATDGKLWIGTRNGLYVYDPPTYAYRHLTTHDGLADNFVKTICPDSRGNVWVTSDNSITCISAATYDCQVFTADDGIGNAVFHVRAAVCTPQGDMLFGTSKGCMKAVMGTPSTYHSSPNAQSFVLQPTTLLIAVAILLIIAVQLTWYFVKRGRRKVQTFSQRLSANRQGTSTDIEPQKMAVSSVDEQLKEKAIRIVEDNISNSEFSVEDLSAALGMSRGHLYKRLEAITGKSPIEFIRIIRVKQGRHLLEQSGESVSQVAWRVGMSPKQFSKYFKEEYGMLPSEFLRNRPSCE